MAWTTTSAEAALAMGIEDEMTYFNIHTVNNPGGEIRSELFPAPEPASLILLGSECIPKRGQPGDVSGQANERFSAIASP
jgi:hypothetical protein